jgi:protein involved in polysaccharide export with SLBB domain
LGPGDQISFRVIEDEDPPRLLTITDSGEMEVPYLGRLKAAGKTCKAIAYEIKAALEKEYYLQASVILGLDVIAPLAARDAISRGTIYLMGQVRSQGPQEIPAIDNYTVSKAILRAGGFAEYANKRKVKIIRKTGNKSETETKVIDLVEILEKGKTEKDIIVQPEDLIIVPERWINF